MRRGATRFDRAERRQADALRASNKRLASASVVDERSAGMEVQGH